MNQPESPFRVQVPIQVRFSDLDGMGHINNANYLSYFEIGRMAYLRQVLEMQSLQAISFILAEATVRFRAQGKLEEPLTLGLRVGELRNSSFTFEYELVETRNGRLIATGTTVQVWYDYERGHPVRVPAEVRQRIRAFEGLPPDQDS
jgi:acyl-CoA thioester hydrolase